MKHITLSGDSRIKGRRRAVTPITARVGIDNNRIMIELWSQRTKDANEAHTWLNLSRRDWADLVKGVEE